MTLRQGLEQLMEDNAAVFDTRDRSPEAQEFFRCHDLAHVVFGCDTTVLGEGILKIFTLWGTTLGLKNHLSGYSEASAFSLFKHYGWRRASRQVLKLIVLSPQAISRARKMSRPWPWADHDAYLDQSLAAVRAEFNIEVFSQSPGPREPKSAR